MRKVRRLLKENWIPIVVGILLTKWAVDYAYRVRGYDAIGSEWLVLPFTIFIFNWGKAVWEELRGEAFLAYSDDIGTEFEDMEDFPDKDSRESEIERTITDALLVHPATEYVRNFIFDYSSGDAVVSFIVKGAQWEEEETISTVFEKGVS